MDENIEDIRSCSKLIMCNGNTLYTTRIYGDLDTINKLKQSSKVKTPIKRCVQPLPSTAGTSLSLKSKLKPIIVNSNKNDDDDDTTDIMGKSMFEFILKFNNFFTFLKIILRFRYCSNIKCRW